MACTRRAFLSQLVMWPGLAVLSAGLGCGGAMLRCSEPSALTTSQSRMRESLEYADVSPHGAEKQCGGCRFFQSRAEAACGGCEILGSAVSVTGYCHSWSEA
jgi:hypothetical protein